MSNINFEALKVMNAFIEDGERVVSSIDLSNALGVRHDNMVVSIKTTITKLEEALKLTDHQETTNAMLRRYKWRLVKTPLRSNFGYYYLLNREFVSELISRYDMIARNAILGVFWKTSDGLKEAGYNHSDIEELSSNVDDAIGKLKKLAEDSYMVDWNEVDLDDDNPLFEYEPYQYAIALIREIVKKHDLAKIINLVIDAGQMDDKLCDMFIALYEFGVSSQHKIEIDLSKFKKNK